MGAERYADCATDCGSTMANPCAADCIASIKQWSVRNPSGRLLAAAVDADAAADDRTIVTKLTRPFPLLVTGAKQAFYPPFGRMSELILNHLQPPFEDVRVRQAVQMRVKQEDDMRATFGDDTSLWRVSPDVFPFGTPYYSDADAGLMGGDTALAAKILKEAGYNGETVVVINPTDFPVIHPLGLVTADALTKIGMNVDLQETDWGSVVQRRSSMQPIDKGGWSVFHTFSSAVVLSSPATHPLLNGRGRQGWFGWWSNAEAMALTDQWLNAADPEAQTQTAKKLAHVAMADGASILVGQHYGKTAFRKSITGVLQGLSPYPWNVRPA